MGELLSKLFDIGKLPSKVVALVCFVSAMLLFAPDKIQDSLHTKSAVSEHGSYVGLLFITSTALLGINIFIWLSKHATHAITRRRIRRNVVKAIARLDRAEAIILREFMIQQKQTIMLPIDEPVVAGLLNKRIIGQVSTVGRRSIAGMLFPVALDPDFVDGLRPDHLGLPLGEPTESDIQRIRSERPPFMDEIARIESLRSF
jgi:hypothetical protein